MPERYDYIVFGASGVVGKYVSKHLSKTEENSVRWAVAGRNKEKIMSTLKEMKIKEIPKIIVTDVENKESILAMCANTKVLLNCVGPYYLYGETVIDSCMKSSTHYIDLTEEKTFITKMYRKHHSESLEKNIYILHSCGFETLLSELSTLLLKDKVNKYQELKLQNKSKTFKEITYFDYRQQYINNLYFFNPEDELSFNYGTYHSFIIDASIRENVSYPSTLGLFTRQRYYLPIWNEKHKRWMCRLPFDCGKYTNYRRQRFYNIEELNEPCFHIEEYIMIKSVLKAILLSLFSILFFILTKFKISRSILLKYPDFFSGGFFKKLPPSDSQIEKITFKMISEITTPDSRGEAIPEDMNVIMPEDNSITIKGPEPGYIATAVCMVSCAKILLKMKIKNGGVETPGSVFGKDVKELLEELSKNGISSK